MVDALFKKYDTDNSDTLDTEEVRAMLAQMQVTLPGSAIRELMKEVGGVDGIINRDEFGEFLNKAIDKNKDSRLLSLRNFKPEGLNGDRPAKGDASAAESGVALLSSEEEEEDDDGEEDGESDEAEGLTPAQIRRKALGTLALGVGLVTIFSDPMVNVLSEIADRTNIPAFYVGFIIAPVISNASEIISSIAQAQKKKKANIDVTYSQLLGAATMNVSFPSESGTAPAAPCQLTALPAHFFCAPPYLHSPPRIRHTHIYKQCAAEHLLHVHLSSSRLH
jgi:hypothetical protein